MDTRIGFRNDAPIGPFTHDGDGDLARAVDRDAIRVATEHGYVPSIRRYLACVDPARDGEAARALLMQAFQCAGRHAGMLAACWRAAYPAWRDCIDACLAAHQLLGIPLAMVGEAVSLVGPPQRDGRLRYELIERIGQGADGQVFCAIDHALSRGDEESLVAVKIVFCTRSMRDALLAEAALARRVSHGGVARVLDAGLFPDADDGCYIVTELVAGMPLHVWHAAHSGGCARERQAIVAQLRDALGACHRAGVVHGDLSPSNIVVNEEGCAIIIDFGRASKVTGRWRATASARGDLQTLAAIEAWLLRDAPTLDASEERALAAARLRRLHRLRMRGAAVLTLACVLLAGVLWQTWRVSSGDLVVARLFGTEAFALAGPESRSIARHLTQQGLVPWLSTEQLNSMALAWSAQASERRAEGRACRGFERLVATALLAAGETRLARIHALRSQRGEVEAHEAECAGFTRLVIGLARWFTADGEPHPPGEVTRTRRAALQLGVTGLLDIPSVRERVRDEAASDRTKREFSISGRAILLDYGIIKI